MDSILKKEHSGQILVIIVFIIYLISGTSTPEPVASIIDTFIGKIFLLLTIITLFKYAHPILSILAVFVAFELMRRSSISTGTYGLARYVPNETTKDCQMKKMNDFPYPTTLEEEVVKQRVPLLNTGSSMNPASFHPFVENTYQASSLCKMNK
jgi:fumarate reductase subunit D